MVVQIFVRVGWRNTTCPLFPLSDSFWLAWYLYSPRCIFRHCRLKPRCHEATGKIPDEFLWEQARLYVNDLSSVPRNCSTECYVNDTKICMSFNVKDCDDAVAAVNEDLHNIRNWCFQNGLLLNPEKTKLIVYGGRHPRRPRGG